MPQKNLLSLHEAIVLALINQPSRTASFEDIATFIEERNLYPERKGNIPLATQVMLRATKAKGAYYHLFKEVGTDYISLRNTIEPLAIWNMLEAVLQHDRQFYNPDSKQLNVVDLNFGVKQNRKIEVSPADIICICSTGKSRSKDVYIKQYQPSGEQAVVCYRFNNNQFNFESLCDYLDPTNGYLVIVSKNALVNVGHYVLSDKNELVPIVDISKFEIPNHISMTSKLHLRQFQLVQKAYTRGVLLQKAAIGYKTDMGI